MTLGKQWKDLGFKESDIVSVYTDEQAVEDGVLVRSEGVLPCPFNRVTRAVWDEFTQPMKSKGSVIVMTNTTKLSHLGEAVNRKYKAGELTEGWVVLEFEGHKIWAMPNETTYSKIAPVPGWTIMFPDDY
jgi:hypothetical protein